MSDEPSEVEFRDAPDGTKAYVFLSAADFEAIAGGMGAEIPLGEGPIVEIVIMRRP